MGLGKIGVYLASLLEGKIPLAAATVGKKHGFRVTSSEVAQAYHLLHQVNMTGQLSSLSPLLCYTFASTTKVCRCKFINPLAPGTGSHLNGLGLYLAVSALNHAEADRPKKRLPGPVVSEIYFSLGLQSSLSLPYFSSLAMVSS